MAYQLETYTGVVLSNFGKKTEAEKQLRMYNEPGETRYELNLPVLKK